VFATHGPADAVLPMRAALEDSRDVTACSIPPRAKVTGAGFHFMWGDGARLVRALIQFFIEEAGKAWLPGGHPPSL